MVLNSVEPIEGTSFCRLRCEFLTANLLGTEFQSNDRSKNLAYSDFNEPSRLASILNYAPRTLETEPQNRVIRVLGKQSGKLGIFISPSPMLESLQTECSKAPGNNDEICS